MKKKVNSKFSFPQVLDMSSRLGVDGPSGSCAEKSLLYDLSCILIHKGSTTNSGHYVANIKDDVKGEWWEFDDELVTSLGSHPCGEVPGKSLKKEVKREIHVSGGKASSSQDASCSAAPDAVLTSDTDTHEESPDQFGICLTSADAYMLIYNLREPLGATTNEDSFDLPDDLRCKIEAQNKDLLDKCREYKLKLDKEISDRADRQREIKTISGQLPAQSQDDYFWISGRWLRTWADDLKPS